MLEHAAALRAAAGVLDSASGALELDRPGLFGCSRSTRRRIRIRRDNARVAIPGRLVSSECLLGSPAFHCPRFLRLVHRELTGHDFTAGSDSYAASTARA